MRFDGVIIRWNEERGFGFIAPKLGGDEIFVHISALKRGAVMAREGECISFEVEVSPQGKKRAVHVGPPASAMVHSAPVARTPACAPRLHRGYSSSKRNWRFTGGAIALLVVAVVYAYDQYEKMQTRLQRPVATETELVLPRPESTVPKIDLRFSCDGRTYCSQMTSCTEAKYFLKNCPGVKMDGDNDGTPCEEQWCKSPLAR